MLITIAYLINCWVLVNGWGDSVFIIIGVAIFQLLLIFGFLTATYPLIFFGLLMSWGTYAISLSGRPLPPDTLLLFSILLYAIGICMMFVIPDDRASARSRKSNINLIGLLVSSIFALIILSIIRSLLPLLGSFTILLVIPAILLLCITPKIGCLASFIAIPMLITSALAERYFLTFPNPLLISIFVGLDLALLLNILISPHDFKKLLDKLASYLGFVQGNYSPFPCQNCGASMESIDNSNIDDYLSYPQQVAHSIDSLQYFAWRCPQCHPHLPSPGIHLRGYIQERAHNNSDTWAGVVSASIVIAVKGRRNRFIGFLGKGVLVVLLMSGKVARVVSTSVAGGRTVTVQGEIGNGIMLK